MNYFENILYNLSNLTMKTPVRFGWFHFMWIGIIILAIITSYLLRKKYNEKMLKWALFLYGSITFLLELLKQIMWSFNYDDGIVTWSYTWYAAPFQLCTTPLFISLVTLFLKKCKFRDALLSYLVFFITITSLMVIILPDSCFTSQILINVHTMYLHCMSFALSIFLIINREVEIKKENLFNAIKVFLTFVFIALALDIIVYNLDVLNGDTFNMFFISPYFPSTLPVFSLFYDKIPYILFLISYLLIVITGASIVYLVLKRGDER